MKQARRSITSNLFQFSLPTPISVYFIEQKKNRKEYSLNSFPNKIKSIRIPYSAWIRIIWNLDKRKEMKWDQIKIAWTDWIKCGQKCVQVCVCVFCRMWFHLCWTKLFRHALQDFYSIFVHTIYFICSVFLWLL